MNDPHELNDPAGQGSHKLRTPPVRIGKKRRLTGILINVVIAGLILVGLYLVLNPYYLHWRQDRKTAELIDAFEQGDGTIILYEDQLAVPGEEEEFIDQIEDWGDPSESSVDPDATTATGPSGSGPSVSVPSGSVDPSKTLATTVTSPVTTTTARPTPKPTPKPIVITAIGQIQIEKINLTMPIADRAEATPLRVAVGLLGGSAFPGEPGNTIILGHRMYTYGRHFNRLDEVTTGDKIVITTKERKLTYRVDKQSIILPSELRSVLSEYTAEKKLILVTCTPVRVASHRLLVYATLESDTPI